MKTITYIILLLIVPLGAIAQQAEANDYFSHIGKIYVVAAVMLLLFGTIVAFLIYLERKLDRIENMMED